MHPTKVLLLALLVWCGTAVAADIEGPARVIDGDTLEIAGERIRLHGIDAPEMGQGCTRRNGTVWRCGLTARAALARMVKGAEVRCEVRDHDKYGRTVAKCFVAGLDLEAAMVGKGLAIAYRAYSMDYAVVEDEARAARRGIWSTTFAEPHDWRQAHRR